MFVLRNQDSTTSARPIHYGRFNVAECKPQSAERLYVRGAAAIG